ncbi:MAG: hypothetical protein ACP5LG_08040, partial [Conexivisphaera sp.]
MGGEPRSTVPVSVRDFLRFLCSSAPVAAMFLTVYASAWLLTVLGMTAGLPLTPHNPLVGAFTYALVFDDWGHYSLWMFIAIWLLSAFLLAAIRSVSPGAVAHLEGPKQWSIAAVSIYLSAALGSFFSLAFFGALIEELELGGHTGAAAFLGSLLESHGIVGQSALVYAAIGYLAALLICASARIHGRDPRGLVAARSVAATWLVVIIAALRLQFSEVANWEAHTYSLLLGMAFGLLISVLSAR